MILHNHLQPLHDLDRSSPQFHKQLIEFLRGNEYRDVVPILQGEDLAWLVEYLDNVSLRAIFSHFALNAWVGPCRYFRSCKPRVPAISA